MPAGLRDIDSTEHSRQLFDFFLVIERMDVHQRLALVGPLADDNMAISLRGDVRKMGDCLLYTSDAADE